MRTPQPVWREVQELDVSQQLASYGTLIIDDHSHLIEEHFRWNATKLGEGLFQAVGSAPTSSRVEPHTAQSE